MRISFDTRRKLQEICQRQGANPEAVEQAYYDMLQANFEQDINDIIKEGEL